MGDGSALLMVLWAMALMSVTVLGVVELVDQSLDETILFTRDTRARQLAESGIAVGLHPNVERGDAVLQQTFADGEGFSVQLSSEGARLPINHLLLGNHRSPLIALFEAWGLSSDEASALVDCLQDWVDVDDLKHLNGAEQEDYAATGLARYPPNRPFQSVEEMVNVRGMNLLAEKKPDWKNDFTVWSDGKLDVNQAPAELLQVVCGVTASQALALVGHRLGPDGQPETADDRRLTNLDEVRQVVGIPQEAFRTISNLLALQDSVWRIESTGHVGEYRRTVILVARRAVRPPQSLAWLEP